MSFKKVRLFGSASLSLAYLAKGSVDAYSEKNINLDYLLSLIKELPPKYQIVFNLYVLDGYSHQEISELLKISIGTSKSNLYRARKILQKKINDESEINKLCRLA